jgi:hypothetical protein
MRFKILLFLTWALTLAGATASELQLTISADRPTYQLGDKMRLRITYKNVSGHSIKLLPQPEVYLADSVKVTSRQRAQSVEELRHSEIGIDFQQLSKHVMVLRPGRSYHRDITVGFVASLPPYFNDTTPGLFLVFQGASALKLPSFGTYDLVANYVSPADNPVKQYLPKASPTLWEGEARSLPVVVTFRGN